MIRVRGLEKRYGARADGTRAVAGVDLDIREGEFYTLLGPSGCGKTTTLRCVAGLEDPSAGEITVGDTVVFGADRAVPSYQRDIGMVFQSYAVWPHMTVYDNTIYPLRVGKDRLTRAEEKSSVESVLELVGLDHLADRMATQLSGGQQQRLSLARALVRRPKALLLDEPLSNLDARLRDRMRQEISILQRRLNITTLFVTHDQVEALSMSDRIAVMRAGQVVQEGTPREIFEQPSSQYVAEFVGGTNVLRGTVRVHGPGAGAVETEFGEVAFSGGDDKLTDGQPVVVLVRPEDVEAGSGPASPTSTHSSFTGVCEQQSFTGSVTERRIRLSETTVLTTRGSSRQTVPDGRVTISIPAEYCRVLPQDHEVASDAP